MGNKNPPAITAGGVYVQPILCSLKFITIDELVLYTSVHHIPHKIFLKYTVSECITETVDDCIETRFSGVGLPSTIKDSHKVITQCGDVIAMQINKRFTVAVNYLSVARSPVFAVRDGVVHLLFNLSHKML
tara:strand:+ start:1830 stop:2222 length:393 start_codon:yes stop_codon:yes gene_type:complete